MSSPSLLDKRSDEKLMLKYKISNDLGQIQSEMTEVDCFVNDNFHQCSKEVLENISAEVNLIRLQCEMLKRATDNWRNRLSFS